MNVGGAEYMLARFLRCLGQDNYRAAVLSLMTPGPLEVHVAAAGASVHSLSMRQGRFSLSSVRSLNGIFQKIKPELVHGWMYHGNIAASIGCRIGHLNAPIIWSVHHSLYDIAVEKPLTQKLIRLSARLSNQASAITYSSYVAAKQHEAVGFDPRHRVVIHNGIDCEEFQPAFPGAKLALAQRLRIPDQRVIIGSIGRFHPMKDQATLVQAFAQLLAEGYDIHGLFVGAGHEDGVVIKTAQQLGIDDRISTLGASDDIPAIAPGLDIHAISSAWGETFSMATAEAMASGVPSLVTDVGDCALVVGDTGEVVARRDPKALAAALRRLLDLGRDARRQLGARARRRIVENFSLQRYVDSHVALYQKLHEGRLLKPKQM
ncbi:glycosyltransferase [Mesorhizobium sp.]|uniref:glycosyltransferase n=1 Tax=Mesorhizobium sp. TaxID=1871066 RepID=UPI0025DDF5DF|nr:glycosyltransferase [Mesorhizobium sp.]